MITLQEEPLLLGLLFVLIYCVVTVLGLVVALIAWAGARAGIVVGALILLGGVANLVYTLLTPWPRLWWVSIGPIYAGWLAMAAWRGRGESLQRLSFRFRLRGLMLLVAVCAIVIGGITAYYRGERYEQQVLAPLRGIVDVHQTAFGRADFVILHAENEKTFKEAMAALAQLDQMRSLQVNESNVPPDAAMRQFAQLTSLRWLLLQRLPVADADLEPLGNLERLEMLELDGSRLSDAGLVHLYPLKRLNKLYLYGADPQKVSAQGLKRLHAELPNLLPGYL